MTIAEKWWGESSSGVGQPRSNLDPISLSEIQKLCSMNHVVTVHPMKAIVVIDGFKRRRIALGLVPAAARIVSDNK